ncbi:MAG: HAMP domain-containing sensor histidine kinase, partial [Natronomonas sp.]
LTTAEKQRAVVGLLVDPPDRQVIDLEAMLTSIVEGARTEYSTAAIETDCVGDCSIRAVSQIRCAFVELLDNALTHNTEGDPTVEITVTEDDAGVTVRICDNGPPIPEHEFRTLTGERELSEVYHGTGMGLWLVYLAVGVSGGTIDFTQEGCGNTITLEFDRPDHRT